MLSNEKNIVDEVINGIIEKEHSILEEIKKETTLKNVFKNFLKQINKDCKELWNEMRLFVFSFIYSLFFITFVSGVIFSNNINFFLRDGGMLIKFWFLISTAIVAVSVIVCLSILAVNLSNRLKEIAQVKYKVDKNYKDLLNENIEKINDYDFLTLIKETLSEEQLNEVKKVLIWAKKEEYELEYLDLVDFSEIEEDYKEKHSEEYLKEKEKIEKFLNS